MIWPLLDAFTWDIKSCFLRNWSEIKLVKNKHLPTGFKRINVIQRKTKFSHYTNSFCSVFPRCFTFSVNLDLMFWHSDICTGELKHWGRYSCFAVHSTFNEFWFVEEWIKEMNKDATRAHRSSLVSGLVPPEAACGAEPSTARYWDPWVWRWRTRRQIKMGNMGKTLPPVCSSTYTFSWPDIHWGQNTHQMNTLDRRMLQSSRVTASRH